MDPTKPEKFFFDRQWNQDRLNLSTFVPKDKRVPEAGSVARSFSGHERNRMFLQTEKNFDDVSLVSGADFPSDSRSFALLDYDRDGFLDLAVTSPLRPRLQIFRNRIGERTKPNARSLDRSIHQFVFVRLTGGNQSSQPTMDWSSRDGYGASLLVVSRQVERAYQYSCGEGLAVQNSRWLHIGLGESELIDRIEIAWPSGKKTIHKDLVAGKRYELFETGKTEISTAKVSKSDQ